MLNTLTKFEELLQEHEVIRADVRQIENSTDHLLALCHLQDHPGQFTTYQINILSEKRLSLKRAIIDLKEGLVDHHQREEESMRSLIGDPLMQILIQEHRKIIDTLADIDWILLNIGPTGILFNIDFLKDKIGTMSRTLSSISVKEDSVLDLLIRLYEN